MLLIYIVYNILSFNISSINIVTSDRKWPIETMTLEYM